MNKNNCQSNQTNQAYLNAEYPEEMNKIENYYAEFIAKSLNDSELVKVLTQRNLNPITNLIKDMVESDDKEVKGKLGSDEIFHQFSDNIIAKVLDALEAKRRVVDEKESCDRFIKTSSNDSLKFCIDDLVSFVKAMNVKISRAQAEQLSVILAKELGNKLHDIVFDIIRDFCKQNGIKPGALSN